MHRLFIIYIIILYIHLFVKFFPILPFFLALKPKNRIDNIMHEAMMFLHRRVDICCRNMIQSFYKQIKIRSVKYGKYIGI